MTWQEYQTIQAATNPSGSWIKTDIECPECGEPIYKNTGMVLTSYPVQYRYECQNCGWTQTGH